MVIRLSVDSSLAVLVCWVLGIRLSARANKVSFKNLSNKTRQTAVDATELIYWLIWLPSTGSAKGFSWDKKVRT
jgi:hypothetical protein